MNQSTGTTFTPEQMRKSRDPWGSGPRHKAADAYKRDNYARGPIWWPRSTPESTFESRGGSLHSHPHIGRHHPDHQEGAL